MTLREAISRAHARGDHEERNRLMAYANEATTLRDLAALLGVSLNTAHRWTTTGRTENPCSRLDSAAPGRTLVATQKRPGDAPTSRAMATRSTP